MKFAKSNMVGFATRFGDQWEGVRCGAKTRSGSVCQRPAYKVNGKCHLHGGASTGPRTEMPSLIFGNHLGLGPGRYFFFTAFLCHHLVQGLRRYCHFTTLIILCHHLVL